jgi:hypothetical protein
MVVAFYHLHYERLSHPLTERLAISQRAATISRRFDAIIEDLPPSDSDGYI